MDISKISISEWNKIYVPICVLSILIFTNSKEFIDLKWKVFLESASISFLIQSIFHYLKLISIQKDSSILQTLLSFLSLIVNGIILFFLVELDEKIFVVLGFFIAYYTHLFIVVLTIFLKRKKH